MALFVDEWSIEEVSTHKYLYHRSLVWIGPIAFVTLLRL